MSNYESKEVAKDILNHINKKNLKFWSTRYELRKGIYCTKKGENYKTSYEVAKGTLYLVNRNKLIRISQRRFEVNTELKLKL